MTGLIEKIHRIYIHPDYLKDEQKREKAILLVNTFLITAVAAFSYTGISVFIDYPVGIYSTIIMGMIFIIVPVLFRKPNMTVWVSNIYVASSAVSTILLVHTSGGILSAVAPWMAITPLGALLYIGRKSAWFWAIFMVIATYYFGISEFFLGQEFIPQFNTKWTVPFNMMSLSGFILVALLYNLIFEGEKNEAMQIVRDKSKEVHQQNEEIHQQNEELVSMTDQLQAKNILVEEQNTALTEQKHVIEMAHKKITSSITYAERIQKAILPQPQRISSMFPEAFVFFRPRDVVSGDFYWCAFVRDKQGNKKVIFATGDCTGHGVPGAFMSMAGANLLAQIVNDRKIANPAFILDLLHAGIRNLLQQDENENRDGMDISISVVNWNDKILEYSGAKRPLYYVQNGEMHQIKGDVYPVGGFLRGVNRKFTTHQVSFAESSLMAYTFSDGYPDQIGGREVRKFMTKHFRKMLLEISNKSMRVQKQHLGITLDKWKGEHKQLDDILVVGMRLM